MVKALIEKLKEKKEDNRFCTLIEEKENLELFEKYKKVLVIFCHFQFITEKEYTFLI